MSTKKFLINHSKPEAASTISWNSRRSEQFNIEDLKPYLAWVTCFTGYEFHELSIEAGDFECLELNVFEIVSGTAGVWEIGSGSPGNYPKTNVYKVCFTAVISIDLEKHPCFKEGLEQSDDKVQGKLNFKTQNGDDLGGHDHFGLFQYEEYTWTYTWSSPRNRKTSS